MITARCSGVTIGPAPSRAVAAGEYVQPSAENRSPMPRPSSLTSEYSVLTLGLTLSRSICEIRLAETPIRPRELAQAHAELLALGAEPRPDVRRLVHLRDAGRQIAHRSRPAISAAMRSAPGRWASSSGGL